MRDRRHQEPPTPIQMKNLTVIAESKETILIGGNLNDLPQRDALSFGESWQNGISGGQGVASEHPADNPGAPPGAPLSAASLWRLAVWSNLQPYLQPKYPRHLVGIILNQYGSTCANGNRNTINTSTAPNVAAFRSNSPSNNGGKFGRSPGTCTNADTGKASTSWPGFSAGVLTRQETCGLSRRKTTTIWYLQKRVHEGCATVAPQGRHITLRKLKTINTGSSDFASFHRRCDGCG